MSGSISKDLTDFCQTLRQDLQAPLPGRDAQFVMAPQPRPGSESHDQPSADARKGGVLILLYPHQATLFMPLILRPTYDGVHSGQVGLPGGGVEEEDEDVIATALREAQEEIGVNPAEIDVLGQLTPLYIRPSNYQVHPTVGWIAQRPLFQPDAYEVAQLLEVPLCDLLDPANHRSERWQLRDRQADVPFFQIQGQTIWGATAMMLSEFIALPTIQRFASSDSLPNLG